MTSLVLGDLILESLTPSANAPLFNMIQVMVVVKWPTRSLVSGIIVALQLAQYMLRPKGATRANLGLVSQPVVDYIM
jgi:hypothetical protein